MSNNSYKRKKNLLALFLSLMMATTTAAGFVACDDDAENSSSSSSSSSSSTTTATDTARIKNGSFEFTNEDETKLIVTSPTGWSVSRDTNAGTSKTASGIIDVSSEAWDNLTKSKVNTLPTTAEAAASVWNDMSAYDKLKFYEAWEDGEHDEDVDELDFYDKSKDDFNIDLEDVPTPTGGNPGANPEAEEGDTKILMLHNSYGDDSTGTAYKATSSSTVTVKAGTSAIFSVWVKTQDLKFQDDQNVIGNRGAYIGVTHTVGGQTLDQLQVKNINTERDDDAQNGWVKYEFFLRGCSFADSTFTVVLGLGQGVTTNSNANSREYVSGYAFFDDLTCEIVSEEKYEAELPAGIPTVDLDSEKEEKLFDAAGDDKENKQYAIDLYAGFDDYNATGSGRLLSTDMSAPALVAEKKGQITYVVAEDNDPSTTVYEQLGSGFDTENDVTEVSTPAALKTAYANNSFLQSVFAKDFGENYPFSTNEEILLLMSASGANYKTTLSNEAFKLSAGERVAISFFVKTSDMKGVTGAFVTLKGDANAAISTIDTTGIVTVDTDERENIYDGWQQCFFFVENDTDSSEPLEFTLEFAIGPKTIVGTTKASYYAGYAAFAGFQINEDFGEHAFDYTASGTYTQTVSLVGNETEYSNDVFDSPAYVPTDAIETGIAQLKNYTGVYGGSAYVSGKENLDASKNDQRNYSGLISKEYIDNYLTAAATAGDEHWLSAKNLNLDKAGLTALFDNKTQPESGKATQPLLIYNPNFVYDEATDSAVANTQKLSYGFIGTSKTLSASSYTIVSLRVKVSDGAKAFVYLTDMDDLTHESTLSIGRQISYWYDADGNICASDPTADGFNKKTDIAFKLQENGLYLVDEKWLDKPADLTAGYYANLSNYAKDAEGNLVVAEGGVSYNYNSKWDGEGLDGIAFYAGENGKYYADRAKTVEVFDLSTVSALKPRYTALAENKELSVEVGPTGGDWQLVTFYIHTGVEAKNYRLEVWSGDREGTEENKSAVGSYVMFDANSITKTLDATVYGNLLNGAISSIKASNGYATDDEFKANYDGVFYNAYSFYDQASFLRYNAALDDNGVGNSYDEYDATAAAYTDTLAYLYYAKAGSKTVFVDWSQHDVTVDPDPVEDEEEEEETEEETTTGDETNPWLLAGSIAIVAALLIAIIGIALRPVWKKVNRAKARKARTPKAKKDGKPKAKKTVKTEEKQKDEKDPYND